MHTQHSISVYDMCAGTGQSEMSVLEAIITLPSGSSISLSLALALTNVLSSIVVEFVTCY